MSTTLKRTKFVGKVGFIVFINILVLLFLVIAFGREYVGNMQIEREISELEAQRDSLEHDKLSTQTLIDQLSSEYFLETEARLKHGLGQNGESVIIVQAAEGEATTAENSENSGLMAPDGIGNPLRWYYYFFNQDLFRQLKEL